MDKQKKEIIITGVLALVFVFTLANSIRKIKARYSPAARPVVQSMPGKAQVSVPPESPKQEDAALLKNIEKEQLDWIRDPFSGKIYFSKEEGAAVDLSLTGIVWDELKPRALINSDIVQEGSTIGQFRVLKIYKDKVVLEQGAKTFELRLKQ